jgi:hypothetical protein
MHRLAQLQRHRYRVALKAWLLRSSVWVYAIGLFRLTEGAVRLDGVNLRRTRLKDWSAGFGAALGWAAKIGDD